MDISVLRRFARSALLAAIEPNSPEGGCLSALVEDTVPLSLHRMAAGAGDNRGPRRIVVVGEGEGRFAREPIDLAYPTMAVAVEVRDAAEAARQQDRLLAACVATIGRELMPDGCLPLRMPTVERMPAGAVRSVELERAVRAVIGDHPLASTAGVHWCVVDGDDSSWQVFASDRDLLDDVSRDLRGPDAAHAMALIGTGGLVDDPGAFGPSARGGPDGETGSWDLAGVANGARIAGHLRSWVPHAGLIVPAAVAPAFSSTLGRLADLAAAFDGVRWRLWRPDSVSVRTDVILDLSGAGSEPRPFVPRRLVPVDAAETSAPRRRP